MAQSQMQEKVSQLTPKESDTQRKSTVKIEEKTRPLSHSLKNYITASFVLQMLLLLSFAVLAGFTANKLKNAMAQNLTQSDLIAQQTNKINELAHISVLMKSEIEELRHFIASKSSVNEIFLKIMILNADLDPTLATEIAQLVHKYAIIYGRDPDLVLSIIATESSFNPKAVSPAGAEGLMQIMPQWKKVLGIKNSLFDPETSINYGLQILGFYKEMYKETDMALTAYNRGPGPVDMALMRGDNPKNNYAPTVFKTYDRLKSLNVTDKRN